MRTMLVLFALTLSASCDDPPVGRFACTQNADCPDGYTCRIGVADRTQLLCYDTDVDAPRDAGTDAQ